MPKVVRIPYAPRPQQLSIHRALDENRFGVVVCHRRMGKTVFAVNHLIKAALTSSKTEPRYGYLGPTYRQAKNAAWDYFVRFTSPIPGRKVNQSELRIDLPNGARLRIHGVDNPDSLRGMYFDGVVLDEYGMFPANAWSEVIWPMLTDRQGWALMMGTPNGKNDFYEKAQDAKAGKDGWFFSEYPVSVTGLIDMDELQRAKGQMTEDEYRQEYECSFEAAVKGSIYGRELEDALAAGRIGSVPYDPALPVDTDWDLGIGDSMAIWFSQSLRSGEIHLIDYEEGSGEGFPYYAKVLGSKPYTYGRHWAPHDITVRELGTGRSRLEVAREYGLKFEVTPRLHKASGNEVEEGIHAARMLLPKCFFDAEGCKDGLEALRHYRRDYNQRLDEFKASPVHDWASHGADAFRGLAVRHRIPQEQKEKRAVRMPREWTWS